MIPRALPPSGVCIRLTDILAGLQAARQGDKALRGFRDAICQYFGVRHAVFTSSGRAALSVLLTALQSLYPDKNEVVLPAYTSFSVPSAAVNAGCKVALYDLEASTLSPNLDSLRECLSDKTLCIVVCHLYGYPCDMEAICEIAAGKGIPVVDDAAQAMGARYKGRYIGTLGTAGIFSLSRGKNITAVDGGIIVTDDATLTEALQKINLPQPMGTDSISLYLKAFILSFLLYPWIYWLPQRMPFLHIGASVFNPHFERGGLTPFQAGIAGKMLDRLAEINSKRKTVAERFCRILKDSCNFIQPVAGSEPVYLRLPVFSATDATRERQGHGVVKSYPLSLDAIPSLRPFLVATDKRYPVSQNLAETLVTLPTHEFVTESDTDRIITNLRQG